MALSTSSKLKNFFVRISPTFKKRQADKKEAKQLAGSLIQYSDRIPIVQKYADSLLKKSGAKSVFIETKGTTTLSGENGTNRDRTIYHSAITNLNALSDSRKKEIVKRANEKADTDERIDESSASDPNLVHHLQQDGRNFILSIKINPHTFVHLNLGDRVDPNIARQRIWPLMQKLKAQLTSVSNQEKALYSPSTGLGSKEAMAQHATSFRKTKDWKKGSLGFFDLVKFKSANDKWGMQIGDRLIGKNAELHKAVARNTDALFTPTGDELYLVAPNSKTDVETAYLPRLEEHTHKVWRNRSIRDRLEELSQPLIKNGIRLIEPRKIEIAEKELKDVVKSVEGVNRARFSHLDLSNVHKLLNTHYRGETDADEAKVARAIARHDNTQWLIGLQLYQRAVFHDLQGLKTYGEAESKMDAEIKKKKEAFATHWGMPINRREG